MLQKQPNVVLRIKPYQPIFQKIKPMNKKKNIIHKKTIIMKIIQKYVCIKYLIGYKEM